MTRTYLRILLLTLCAMCVWTGCRPTVADDPQSPNDSQDTLASWKITGDYTENPFLANTASWDVIKLGVKVGDNLDSLMSVLGESTPVLYLVLEYTDRVSSADYHYLPSCWQDVPATELTDTVAAYTANVLQQIRSLGVNVAYVQLSRNISNGFLWSTSDDMLYPSQLMSKNQDGWLRFGQYLSAAGNAVRMVYPKAKIVLQTDLLGSGTSYQQSLFNLLNNWEILGVKYDALSFFYNPVIQGGLSELTNAFAAFDRTVLANRELHFETCYPSSALSEDVGALSWEKVGYPYSSFGQQRYLNDCFELLTKTFPMAENMGYFIYRYASSMDNYQLTDE